MNTIVTDRGFTPDTWPETTLPIEAFDADPMLEAAALDLPGDLEPEALEGRLGGISHIRISFPSFADGRGFTLARQLRRMGFAGQLRARGPVIADQYTMARRAGFDEVEIPDAIAARQSEADWLARSDWKSLGYQSKLQGKRF
jgi:uncharacterized protein (DUF934 family)